MIDATPSTVSRMRLAALLITGFWAFYFVLTTFRAWLSDADEQFHMMGNRSVVAVIGMGLTALLWIVLRRVETWPTRWLVAIVFAASLPIALNYAVVNHLMFYVISPDASALEEFRTKGDKFTKPWQIIVDQALNWYFFIVAWGMVYVALIYAQRMQTAERQMAELQAAAQTAELRALRYQVNPHFLFNTLNSLSSLVMAHRNAEAETMILTMADFFRSSLTGDPTHDVTLADEVALQKLYLAIEQVRFPDRMCVVIDIPCALGLVPVPGLILQPLIENAVRHGVARTTEPVHIRITARRSGDDLILTAEDDARGRGGADGGHGVGIRNVCDRLMARFGDAAGCAYGELASGGYRVTLTIPITVQP